MQAAARWSWRLSLGLCLASLAPACSRALSADAGPPPGGDAGVSLPAGGGGAAADAGPPGPGARVDGGTDSRPPDSGAGSDAGGPAPTTPAAHGGGPLDTAPLSLDGPCDVTLMPARAPAPPIGTLPASGPYRQCDILGGQSFFSVAVSTDGRRAAAIGVGGQIQVLDAQTLAPVATFTRARGPYTAVAISADGARIAAGAELDGELDVWSVDDHVLRLAAELGPIWPTSTGAVAISADGARAAASSGPDTVVADVATGALRRYADNRTCCTSALAFADGGRKLASARYSYASTGWADGSVALMDLATGAETVLIEHNDIHGGDVLAVSGDGTTVMTFRERIQIWDASTGRQRAEIGQPTTAGFSQVLGLNADGSQVAVLLRDFGNDAALWFQHRRTSDGAVVDEIPFGGAPTGRGWSPAGLMLGSGTSTVLGAIDVGSARVVARACSTPRVSVIGFSRDGSRLLDGSGGRQGVIDGASGAPIRVVAGDSPTDVDQIVISPDGARVAWSSFPPTGQTAWLLRVDVEDVEDGAHVALFGPTLNYHTSETIAFSADAARVAALDSYNGIVDVFDVRSASLLGEIQMAKPYGRLFGFTPDGDALRLATDGVLETLSWRDGTVSDAWAYPTSATIVSSFDGDTIVAQTEPGATGAVATVYRDETPIATFPSGSGDCFGEGHYLLLAPGGGALASGFDCGRPWTAREAPNFVVYETATGARAQTFPQPVPPTAMPALSWDGDRIAEGAAIWCR